MRCLDLIAADTTQVGVTLVVGDDHDDVRPLPRRVGGEPTRAGKQQHTDSGTERHRLSSSRLTRFANDSPPLAAAVVVLGMGGGGIDLVPAAEQVADDHVAPPASQPHRHGAVTARPSSPMRQPDTLLLGNVLEQ